MQTWAYPAVFTQVAPEDWVVTFPDVPGAITGGESLESARFNAADALETLILCYLDQGKPIPAPRAANAGEALVILDPVTAARAALAQAMRAQGVSNVALAKRLGKTENAIRRLVDGSSSVKMDTVLQALRALGTTAALETT